jgi:hypothetical protein
LARRRVQGEAHEVFWIRLGAACGLVGLAVQGLFETASRVPANALLAAVLAAIVVHERDGKRQSGARHLESDHEPPRRL